MGRAGDGDAHLVEDVLPFEQRAVGVDARADAHARFGRFAILQPAIDLIARIADGGDAIGQPGAVRGGAEILL